VALINGAQANNVYWKVDGAIDINDYSILSGTFLGNNGAVSINTGATINGRALTTTGTLTTAAVTATVQTICTPTGVNEIVNADEAVTVFPNPFTTSLTIKLEDKFKTAEFQIFNILGAVIMTTNLTEQMTTIETSSLPSGVYFYKVITNTKLIQSGKIISQQ
jgi:hypothetical protein